MVTYSLSNIVYEPVFTSEEVDRFCNQYANASYIPAVIRNRQNIDVADTNKRKSDRFYIEFDPQDTFIAKLTDYITECNESMFGFDNLHYTNPWELLKYTKGDFFKRHHDQINKDFGPFLSAVVYLQDQNDFDGGKTLFYKTNDTAETFTITQRKGYVVVYPSQIYHEVTPITNGTRLTLVNFFTLKNT